MKLLLPFKGSRMDFGSLTAIPGKVRSGKLFKGAGTDQTQTGALPVIAAVEKEIGLNGRYDIPAGIHDSSSTIKQTTLTTLGNVTVYPTGTAQTVNTANKFMAGEINVEDLPGLTPGNIKKGVTILGVTGTYEGYS